MHFGNFRLRATCCLGLRLLEDWYMVVGTCRFGCLHSSNSRAMQAAQCTHMRSVSCTGHGTCINGQNLQ